MAKKNKIFSILPIASLLVAFAVITMTVARNTSSTELETQAHVARFNVTIDEKPTSSIDSKIYATSKVCDIAKNDGVYVGSSFIEDAYQAHSIVIHNDSDTIVNINLGVERQNNDNRVFYAILPNCVDEQGIYAKLYEKTGGNQMTSAQVQEMCRDFNDTEYTLGYDDYLRLTFVTWAEHDAVYVDNDSNGVADEYDKRLSELTAGIPKETFNISCYVVQKD